MFIRFKNLELSDYQNYDFINDIARTLDIDRNNIIIDDVYSGSIIIKLKFLSDNIVPLETTNYLIKQIQNGNGVGLLRNAEDIVLSDNLIFTNTDAYLDIDDNEYTIDLRKITDEMNVTFTIYNLDNLDQSLISLTGTSLKVKSGYRGISYDIVIRISKMVKYKDWILHITERKRLDLSKKYKFSPNFTNLTNVAASYNLNKYFVTTSPYDVIAYEVKAFLSNVTFDIGKHNNLPVFAYDDNTKIITINPEFRNMSYDIWIRAYTSMDQIENVVKIVESDFPQITLVTSNQLMFDSDFEYDLSTLFNKFPYSLYYMISYNSFDINKAHSYPDISMVDNYIVFKQDFRGQEYLINVAVFDPLYEVETKKTFDIFKIVEKFPLIKNFDNYVVDSLTNTDYKLDVRPLFTNYTANQIYYNLVFPIDSNINGELLSSFVHQINSSNIIISPNFRNSSYHFQIDSYISDYDKQHITLDVTVYEY